MNVRNSQYLFFFLMGSAGGLSVIKAGVLARILPATDFAIYAAVFASVPFAADIVSFGTTQGTFKRYPRYVVEGRYRSLVADIARISRRLLVRHLVFLVASVAAATALYGKDGALAALSVSFLAMGINATSISGSLFRALGRLTELGLSTILRAATATVCGIAFALLDGWSTSFFAEAVSGMLIGAGLTSLLYIQLRDRPSAVDDRVEDDAVPSPIDGIMLFSAYFFLTLSTSLDRMFVVKMGEGSAAATYAFIGIWLTTAYTVGSIYMQKLGPELIAHRARNSRFPLLGVVRSRSLFMMLVLGLSTAASLAILDLAFHEAFWDKYGLSASIATAAVLAVGIQVSPIFEWALIALDGERFVLAGAILLTFSMVATFLLAASVGAGFVGYAGGLVLSRTIQLIFLDRSIAILQRKQTPISSVVQS